MGAHFLVPKRVCLLSRATLLVGLLSRVLFWALFGGLSVHRNLNGKVGPETSYCKFKGYAQKLSGWQCHHATRVSGTRWFDWSAQKNDYVSDYIVSPIKFPKGHS